MIVKKIVLISVFSFIYCSKQRLVNLLFLRGEICADICFAEVVITGLLESENVRVCSFFSICVFYLYEILNALFRKQII